MLESDRAQVLNLESLGVGGAGYDETENEPPSSDSRLDKRVRSEDHASSDRVLCHFRSLRLYVSCLSAVFVFAHPSPLLSRVQHS